MFFIRKSLYFLGIALTSIVFSPFGFLLFLVPFPLRYKIITFWSTFSIWWLWITCGISVQLEGKEHLDGSIPTVVLANHQSAWETMAFQTLFPPLSWILKKELLYIPFFGWGLAMVRPIAINRSARHSALKSILRQGIARLQKGIWVVIFPEGTRTAPGKKQSFSLGGAMLAVKAGCRVLPVAHNAGKVWPAKRFPKKPGIVTLRIGAPIETQGRSVAEVNQLAETWIRQQLEQLNQPDQLDKTS